jgi:DNA-binding NarL/FixJ family response regulator
MSALRVVVADDQALVRTGLATVIDAHDDLAVVGQAADGEEAVALVRELRPDVLVTDVRMPGLDGIEVARRVAGPGVEDPTTVLVITTFGLDEYVYESLRAGASGFVMKDVRPADLAAAIRTVAAGQAMLAPEVTRRLIGRYADRVRPAEDTAAAAALASLSPRETEVLRLLARGLSNAEIADELVVSVETVKTFVSRTLTKLDLRDRVQAVVLAYRSGLVSPDD